jgi:hypothetical protein
MRSSEPPPWATWMLDHLVSGEKNEALAGDLLEEFNRRRSVAWYSRQVVGAILAGLSKELRAVWLAAGKEIVWAFGFVTVWTCVVPSYENLILRSSLLQFFYAWIFRQTGSERLIREWTIDIAGSAVIVASGVCFYLGITRGFNFLRLCRGLLVGWFVAVTWNVLAIILIETHLLLVSRLVGWFGWGLYDVGFRWLPLSVAVQLSIWVMVLNGARPTHQIEIER